MLINIAFVIKGKRTKSPSVQIIRDTFCAIYTYSIFYISFYSQGVTCRSRSIIENVVDKSIQLTICR